jgi:hypothetical protein
MFSRSTVLELYCVVAGIGFDWVNVWVWHLCSCHGDSSFSCKSLVPSDAVRSQVIDALEAQQIKETGNEED